MSRPRGVLVYPLPVPSGPFDSYALLVRPDGQCRMIHREGVAYLVTEDKPWRWNDYSECEVYTPAQLKAIAATAPAADLADWVRTHNRRLEDNFSQIFHWWASVD